MKLHRQIILACMLLVYAAGMSAQDFVNAFKLGSSGHEEAQGLFQDGQGNLYLSGNFENTVDFDPGSGEALLTAVSKYDAYIAKYDEDWNYLWAISIGGPEWVYGRHIAGDDAGNIYMVGYFHGQADFDPGPGEYLLGGEELNGYVAKYDADGNFVWAFMLGNELNSMAYDIAMDQNGNIWVSGTFKGELDFDPSGGEFILSGHGFQDAYMAQYNAGGEFLWAGEIGGGQSTFSLPRVVCDNDNNLYYATYFNNSCDMDPGPGTQMAVSAGSSDILLIKLDAAGAYQWGFSMGGEFQDQARDIMISNGNIILTGLFEANIDFDPSSGGANFTSTDDYDAYLAAYTTDGEYIWARAIAGLAANCPAEGLALGCDNEHNIYLGGSFYGTVDFDPGANTHELTAQGFWDLYAAKYDHEGNMIWANHAGSNDQDYAHNIMVDRRQEAVLVTGKFQGWAEFDFLGPGRLLTSSGGFDGFMAAYTTYEGAQIGETTPPATINIYPVPAANIINIELPTGTEACRATIFNALGSVMHTGLLQAERNHLDISNYAEGMYLIRIETDKGMEVRKLLIDR